MKTLNMSDSENEGSETRESDHVYLVISPNPEWENYTAAKAYEVKDGVMEELKQYETLHFLKVGDEKNFGSRISKYNTHNPQSLATLPNCTSGPDYHLVWFRYIHFSDYETELQKGLGTSIENELFEGFQRSKSSNEWVLIWNALDELSGLCKRLSKIYELHKKEEVSKKEVKKTYEYVKMEKQEDLIKELRDSGVTGDYYAKPGNSDSSEVQKKHKTDRKDEKARQKDEKRKSKGTGSEEDTE